ncbi:MAG: hypothetical protein JRN15_15665, partial [Nitrososphaerota archaeon]|nr:hypothetical protein [Nitrososphaerota archaeon]
GRGITRDQATRISETIDDATKIIALAERICKTNGKELKKEIADAAIKNPHEDPEEIFRIARSKSARKVNVMLSQEISDALEAATKKYAAEREEIIEDALRGWLHTRGFL